ncbi:hypothetical protein HPB52_018263 [Rhipicephalus sanguineus]|uniref:THAP-type domain-containing protein n=1 Tax=Rhipicephalus sanguineus TaxID=34632 RepID=A0A9D4TB90_RHISA|nr:hypothetical protein HPB52_018263 [Rhipicephalus sanguineus]
MRELCALQEAAAARRCVQSVCIGQKAAKAAAGYRQLSTCCVPWIRSRCKRHDENVSVLWLPRDSERREMRKRAIPRRETGGFTFDSPHMPVCEKYFDESGIGRVHQWLVGGGVVTSQRDVPKLLPGACKNIQSSPAYTTKT